MISSHAVLHLSLIDGIGPVVIHAILNNMPRECSSNDLYNLRSSEFRQLCGLSEKQASLVSKGLTEGALLECELQLLYKHAIALTTIVDEDYPALLKEIEVPPSVLYYRGFLPKSEPALAVVGSRAMDYYGVQVIKKLIPDIVKQGITIVSGGAIGVDRAAHECAIKNNGKTIAVLGSGLLNPYPRTNKSMFEQIVASGGAVMSSFNLQAEAHPSYFPQRNRIISGLSKGCLVVQAAHKSGALITARYALDQGRELFALPGSIDNPLSAGCHALIKEGATLVASAEDIFEGLGLNSTFIAAEEKMPSLSPDEQQVLVQCQEPRSLEDLVAFVDMPLSEMYTVLFKLQMEGYIVQNFAGFWHRV